MVNQTQIDFTSLHAGNFFMIFLLPAFFYKINFFKKLFREYHLSVKQFGSLLRQRFCLRLASRFSYSTQLSTKFILLINVKMPTIVGILTFIIMIIKTSERLKARNFFIGRYFSFYEQLKFHAQLN